MRRVLITGAGTGLGKAMALKLYKSGFEIVLHCRKSIEGALKIKSEIEEISLINYEISNN